MFLTVVETGSFAAAGRRLNRATSVISYTIANLELQLGLSLFDREATRRPQLTEDGRAVLAEARTVAHGIEYWTGGGVLMEVEHADLLDDAIYGSADQDRAEEVGRCPAHK